MDSRSGSTLAQVVKPGGQQNAVGVAAHGYLHAVATRQGGGGQESALRSGTEATAQIAGFARAVELRTENYAAKMAQMAELKAYCREKMLSIPTAVEVGRGQAPHIFSLSLPGYPSANIVTDLGAKGICISAGSACHKGKSSHVVSALGLDKRTAAGVIRLSFGPETTREDIDAAYEALREHKEKRFPML